MAASRREIGAEWASQTNGSSIDPDVLRTNTMAIPAVGSRVLRSGVRGPARARIAHRGGREPEQFAADAGHAGPRDAVEQADGRVAPRRPL